MTASGSPPQTGGFCDHPHPPVILSALLAAKTHGPTYGLLKNASVPQSPSEMPGVPGRPVAKGEEPTLVLPALSAEPRTRLRSPERCLRLALPPRSLMPLGGFKDAII